MSRSPRTRRTGVVTGVVTAIGVVAGALAMAGCGAGQITQTSTQVAGVDGAQGTVGAIAIRDAAFAYAKTDSASIHARGEDAPLQLSIVNTAAADDKLVSASSPAARSVRVTGNPVINGGQTLLVQGAPAVAAPASATASTSATTSANASDSSSTTPSATAAPSASAAPTTTPTTTPTVAPTAAAPNQQAAGAQVVLVGVTQEIRPGLTYPVTFTFQKAGAVTVQVPVANPTAPRTVSAGG